MGDGWLDGWDRVVGNDSGEWAPLPTHPKLVLHTTEGGTIDGAISAFAANNSWPHVTIDPRLRTKVQHVPLNRPARSLRNTSEPGETNRSPITAQVEIVGYAGRIAEMDHADLSWLATQLRVIADAIGCPWRCTVDFPATHTTHPLSHADWDAYEGILGHRHAPENLSGHWDPGGIDITYLLAAGATPRPQPQPPKDDPMTPADLDAIRAVVATELDARGITIDPQRGRFGARILNALTRVERRQGK